MGTQPTTQSSWQYTQQSQTRGKSISLPNRHGAAAIDQIINVVHQPAKLTFHRHRARFNAFTTFWKESRQATRPVELLKVAAHRHRKQLG
jgi:hypothetical protein